jgi:hypothetical protein
MFVQVIFGQVADEARLRAQFDRWRTDLRPGAVGFVGVTAGVAPDGRFVAVVRFDSAHTAEANGARAEQATWWRETRALVEAATFHGSDDVEFLAGGGSDDAGFVQVIEGRTTSRDEFMRLERELEHGGFMAARPDFIGSTIVFWTDGAWLEVAYFTSEAKAREGEKRAFSPGVATIFDEWQRVAAPSSYFDLSDPWTIS